MSALFNSPKSFVERIKVTRQHMSPLLIRSSFKDTIALQSLASDRVSEANIQDLIQAQPDCLPINEIDSTFSRPVPICTEFNNLAGRIDNFLLTATGLPVLIECKLWRNPNARRDVVAQILDYAKELTRWTSFTLENEVNKRLRGDGQSLMSLMRAKVPDLDEAQFHDDLTRNLRRGRFLLLIVGDGIREGVEEITRYLQSHAGLHFTIGLMELPIYVLPDGSWLVAPRILARTQLVTRTVVALPDGYILDRETNTADVEIDPDRSALTDEQQSFWAEFLPRLKLDDPEQDVPKPPRQGYLSLMFPAPNGSSWLTVYRDLHRGEVGVFLSASRQSVGEYAMMSIVEDWDSVSDLLEKTAELTRDKYGRPQIRDSRRFGPLNQSDIRTEAFRWLAKRTNTFVNVLRPRVQSAVLDYQSLSPGC